MIELEAVADGVILPLQAQPKARKNGIIGLHAGRLKVAVTAAPENGKANKAIIKVLADALGVRKSQLSIVAGETSPRKKCHVSGISLDELHRRIAACVESGGE
ncbi:MAG: YggU family protein [Planctomycetaceae bacterium]|jgi:uncharacterized protein|nr:YggU family protein [Planctomycetaceae bacterium]MBT6156740.1 YggU family protein [Planctomycetaceae bacterium]MBT6486031.1 YggU family protein [Planctomycetaceae bacterium]MBT6496172.1 YggU family protein [Planctomycetaceae bacterium]